jgi:hypothetical protein
MHSVVSGALMVKKEIKKNDKTTKQQFPVYFVSEVLTGSKKFYSEMENNCYVVIISSQNLRHYFEAHTIKVLTNKALSDIFGNRDSSGRISKCAMELSEYVVDFEKRGAIKSQVLADYVAEWTEPSSVTEGEVAKTPWVVYCDRACWATGAGAATVHVPPSELSCATQ